MHEKLFDVCVDLFLCVQDALIAMCALPVMILESMIGQSDFQADVSKTCKSEVSMQGFRSWFVCLASK